MRDKAASSACPVGCLKKGRTEKMQHKDTLASPRHAAASDAAVRPTPRQWSTLEYLGAMTQTAALIAPAPFFWSPPFWVLTLMAGPTLPREATSSRPTAYRP